MTKKKTSLRRGRPAKIRAVGDNTYVVNVKGTQYTFTEKDGYVRPKNTVIGSADDRNYAKQLLMLYLEEGEE